MPVERACCKNNINVSFGWMLPVLCMQCCNHQVLRFCGAIPPLGVIYAPPPPVGGTGVTYGEGLQRGGGMQSMKPFVIVTSPII